jgi:hypothetical protein
VKVSRVNECVATHSIFRKCRNIFKRIFRQGGNFGKCRDTYVISPTYSTVVMHPSGYVAHEKVYCMLAVELTYVC